MAFAKTRVGTSPVTMACDAGHPMARKMPVPSKNRYVSATGAPVYDTHARPTPEAASPICAIWISLLRG